MAWHARRNNHPPSARHPRRWRPRVEPLEDRLTPMNSMNGLTANPDVVTLDRSQASSILIDVQANDVTPNPVFIGTFAFPNPSVPGSGPPAHGSVQVVDAANGMLLERPQLRYSLNVGDPFVGQ